MFQQRSKRTQKIQHCQNLLYHFFYLFEFKKVQFNQIGFSRNFDALSAVYVVKRVSFKLKKVTRRISRLEVLHKNMRKKKMLYNIAVHYWSKPLKAILKEFILSKVAGASREFFIEFCSKLPSSYFIEHLLQQEIQLAQCNA